MERDRVIPNVTEATEAELRKATAIEFTDLRDAGGTLTVFEDPDPAAVYAIGADNALGLEGGDLHTACVMRADVRPYRQVAEAAGHWGGTWHLVLYALARWFNGAFIVGERQFGLESLRSLWKMGAWVYYGRDEVKRARPMSDSLGHFKHGDRAFDPLLTAFRRAILRGEVDIRSLDLWEEMAALVFTAKRPSQDGYISDDQQTVKLNVAGSPDRTYAAVYAYHGCVEMPRFPQPASARPGSELSTAAEKELAEERRAKATTRTRRVVHV